MLCSSHHFRKGFPSRLWVQLASHPLRVDYLQELMNVTLELDTRYHERQNKKSHHQEKKPEASKSNSPHPQNSSSSIQRKKKNFQKRDKPHSSLLNKDFKLMNSEKERTIKEGLCTYCGKSLSDDHVVFNGLHCSPSRAQVCILNTGVKSPLKFFSFASLSDVFYSILIDSGATNSFIGKQFSHKYFLTTSELPEKIPLLILGSSESPSLFVTHHTRYMVELLSLPSFEWDFLVIDTTKGEDLILGFDFLNHLNPSIDWRQGLITFNADHKDYYDPSKSFSNDFSSAKSCSALVGDSRTPSFPSSVNIPSLNSHQSLLSSRDEVFKEIEDVAEDNSVYSLHLFFGNMYLPPSSYHDSLEELWDEEEDPEEVEIMMKVVPYVYHQYLDVSSKLKAEKNSPHCTCDYHMKLKGSLPPVQVIYSLSNQESDTLRAYISENV
ncbi:hypothetical protein O181_043083 [Austropuccinia psidii MF-1]|uniref:Peptidase A2 domain-containing protein n=1 Tax=Austropuccinia psidii MF-1 TaxID=1389203 RepID=A0A9Q3DMD6_9BASI|nr:hypothetical protein [Austropuccinia psidii MF-1]